MQSAIKIIMMQKRGDFIAVEWETKAQPSEVIKPCWCGWDSVNTTCRLHFGWRVLEEKGIKLFENDSIAL